VGLHRLRPTGDAAQSRFRPNADKPVDKLLIRQREAVEPASMLREPSVAFNPEELQLLGSVFDQALASLPPAMRTRSNRVEIAKRILACAATGERDPIELELAATMNLTVAA
jgi:hypothetical protein